MLTEIPHATSFDSSQGRLKIRCWQLSDAADLAQLVEHNRSYLEQYMPWTNGYNLTSARQHCRRSIAAYHTLEDFPMGVWLDGQLVGATGFHLRGRPLSSLVAEIGIWICQDRTAKGVATAVAKHLLEWGFWQWPWRRIEWHCDATNQPSRRVAEKAGFEFEGQLRGHSLNHHGIWRDTRIYARCKYHREELNAGWQIQLLGPEHIPRLGALKADTWHDSYSALLTAEQLGSFSSQAAAASLSFLESPDPTTWVAGAVGPRGQVFGYVIWGAAERSHWGHDFEIYALNMPREYQGAGIGKQLMNFARAHGHAAGFKSGQLLCAAGNQKGVSFYKKMGCELAENQVLQDGIDHHVVCFKLQPDKEITVEPN